ncbi:hypothetical protein [Clostridium taeniosporum]|uniref:Uncharacterized protein n=1 Tax=Clostridium taeniosporum TaxID=394958 RepID=A0A1D7XK36_9CLOT|nr:hypothetical protein [Clostridium taeniosporum]AOR23692.1 hypothetical protein BGI42_08085 [Clostridium taeniosporum]
MSYVEKIKTKLEEGTKISDIFDYVPENFNLDNYKNITIPNIKEKANSLPLKCFEEISNPNQQYQNSTTKIDISGLIQFQSYSSISDANLTVDFSTPLTRLQVPTTWATWSSPPVTESSTPPVLFTGTGVSSLTLTLSKPCCTFGFELDPNFNNITITSVVNFYSGQELVGTIQKTVTGRPNTAFFAAKTCCTSPFDRVEISIDEPLGGFAIAQVRYNTDCSSECDCCCTEAVDVNFESYEESKNVPVEITDLKCEGRLLIVDVTVTACENRRVAVGVLICDEEEEDVLRFKVCEACMPESTTPGVPCVDHTFRFCFGFETDLCDPLALKLKTFAEYAYFNFECDC